MGKWLGVLMGLSSALLADPIPRTLDYVCKREVEYTQDCLEMGKNHQFDPTALGTCDNFYDPKMTLDCVNAIRDFTYSLSFLNSCASLSTAKSASEDQKELDCLKKSDGNARPILRADIKTAINAAITSLRGGNSSEAVTQLQWILQTFPDKFDGTAPTAPPATSASGSTAVAPAPMTSASGFGFSPE